MTSAEQSFQTGLGHHRTGDLRQAEQCFRQALALDPQHAGSLHMLGLIAFQAGKLPLAVELIGAASKACPTEPAFLIHQGDALRRLGQLEEAKDAYRQALRLAPDALDAHDGLGAAFKAQQDFISSEACYRETVRLRPDFSIPHYNLGVVLKAQGRVDEAIACYNKAVALQPKLAEAHLNLATIFYGRRDFAAAEAESRRALAVRPGYREAIENLALAIQAMGRLDEALASFDHLVRQFPNSASARFGRANVLKQLNRPQEAVASYLETLQLDPRHADAYHNLGVMYNLALQPDLAVEYCRKGLELDPRSAGLHDGLAFAMHCQGRGEESLALHRKAVECDRRRADLWGNLLYTLNFLPGWTPAAVFAEHLAWASHHAEPLTALAPRHTNDRTPGRQLRVGYVSAHFRRHAVHYFTEPLLASHDHTDFEITCYSDVVKPDDATARFQKSADRWRSIVALSDEQLAQLVREDQIDILVDLAGHIGGNRLLAFARKPAPVQVTYIGYQNTTGMSAMDYRLTDDRADPPGTTDAFYTEKLVRLPRSFFVYQPANDTPPITPLPADAGRGITFGSFNSYRKITPQVVDAWLELLRRVGESRLLVLANRGGYVERHLHDLAEKRQIDPQRIMLHNRRSHGEYLRLIQEADIALDPFPFTGHTTTCDSIWVGVPVVMLEGDTYASRFGGSVLANVGLADLITTSIEGYLQKAVELAHDLPRLRTLRQELRPRMAASPLRDFAGFARHVEAAYRHMWEAWAQSFPGG